MFNNRKVKFIKSNLGMCIYLDDCLFKNNKNKKIINVLKLFSVEKLNIKCICYVENDNIFLEKLKVILKDSYEVVFKKKQTKIQFNIQGSKLDELITLSIKHEILIDAICYDNNEIVMQLIVNDNDGSCIIFNTKKYDLEMIKKNTLLIVKD